MPRPKLSEEQLKLNKQERNKKYYTKNKEVIWYKNKNINKCGVVYIISGLENDKYYVGVSNNFTKRHQQHQYNYADIEIKPLLTFIGETDTTILNEFENFIINYYIGLEKCINKSNTCKFNKDYFFNKIRSNLHHLDEKSKEIVLDCLIKFDSQKIIDTPTQPDAPANLTNEA